MLTLGLLVLLLVLSLALQVASIYLFARVLGAANPTLKLAAVTTSILVGLALLELLIFVPILSVAGSRPQASWIIIIFIAGLVSIVLRICAGIWLMKWIFSMSVARAVALYFSAAMVGMALSILPALGLRLFAEPFVTSGNSMAPTLRGISYTASCPQCGKEAIVTARSYDTIDLDDEPHPGICSQFHAEDYLIEGLKRSQPDRFVVAKWIRPHRWDLIAFRSPEDRRQTYVKRLIGLPGEKIAIQKGQIWINDELISLPAEIAGIEYQADSVEAHRNNTDPTRTWQLEASEYFVLGDFSRNSNDSRLWGPVPAENIIGVVSVLYWPWQRFTIWH